MPAAIARFVMVAAVAAILLVASAVSAAPVAGKTAEAADLTGVFRRTHEAVVRVYLDGQSASGTIVSADGLVVTHIGIATKDTLNVLTPGGRRLKAKLLLRDKNTKLAILRLINDDEAPAEVSAEETPECSSWPHIVPSRGTGLAVGAWVATIAYPVGSDMKQYTQPTFSAGLLAGRGKIASDLTYDGDLLMTDATSNSGSQGGALIDAGGQLVGILTVPVYYRATDSALNVALPAEVVAPLLVRAVESPDPPLEDDSKAASPPAAYIGVVRDGKAENCRISGVAPGSAAETAGLKSGDVITAVDEQKTPDFASLAAILSKAKPGDTVKLTVERATDDGSTELKIDVTLGTRE